MAIYRRNGHWHFTKTVDGIRYRQALKLARTKADAAAEETRILSKIYNGTYDRNRDDRTFEEFLEGVYLPHAKTNKRSWKADVAMLKPVRTVLDKKKLRAITPFDVERVKSLIMRTPGKRPVAGTDDFQMRSRSTINKTIKLLRRIFQMAKLKENPAKEVELLKGETRRKRRLSADERRRLLAAIAEEGKRSHLAKIVIADLNLGLRLGELLSLRPEDVDFGRNLVRVRSTKTDGIEEDMREVPMNTTVREMFFELVSEVRGKKWLYLFTNPRTKTRYRSVKRAFGSACEKAGILDLRFHDLRHAFASNAGDNPNVTLPALMEVLGHRDPRTTLQYVHSNRQGKLQVVNAAEQWENEGTSHKTVTKAKRRAG